MLTSKQLKHSVALTEFILLVFIMNRNGAGLHALLALLSTQHRHKTLRVSARQLRLERHSVNVFVSFERIFRLYSICLGSIAKGGPELFS